MALTAGVLSQISVGSTTASLATTSASGSTGPYTQQWYRSTVSSFTPGSGNIIAGATGLTLNDSGLIPNTSYFYKVIYMDAISGSITSAALAVSTAPPQLNINAFQQSPLVGMIDMRFPYATVAVQIDSTQATPLFFGAAVKFVTSANQPSGVNSVPRVVGCAADSDECIGFINYDIKTISFAAGSMCEISMDGNFMYLYATTAALRGQQAVLDLTTNGGVQVATGGTGGTIVGWFYDQANAPGALVRVKLQTPSFQLDS